MPATPTAKLRRATVLHGLVMVTAALALSHGHLLEAAVNQTIVAANSSSATNSSTATNSSVATTLTTKAAQVSAIPVLNQTNATKPQTTATPTTSGSSNSSTFNYIQVEYHVPAQPFKMNMSETSQVEAAIMFNKDFIVNATSVSILFHTVTLSPQFDILFLNESTKWVNLTRKQIETAHYTHLVNFTLHADYLGRAILKPVSITVDKLIAKLESVERINLDTNNSLQVVIVQYEGVWGIVFMVSVTILILISYINLGAQLDSDNMEATIKKPKTALLGLLITILVMPLATWFAGQWLLSDQLLFRIGSFVFACGPAASASTLWAALLNSDKELSVSLQVGSTLAALFTMPLLLYFMDLTLDLGDSHYTLEVPYMRLISTLFMLLLALLLGWHQLGRKERLQKLSARIFKPLTFSVLLFIIVFSSILYWHIYRMFDRQVMLHALLVALATYAGAGLLGYLINCDADHAIAISVGAAYKNSGIAFAVLMVTFPAPDLYIAYVPCLTQVVTTSLLLYLVYLLQWLVLWARRRGQPIESIRASEEAAKGPVDRRRAPSDSSKAAGGDEEQEESFGVDVDVVVPGEQASSARD